MGEGVVALSVVLLQRPSSHVLPLAEMEIFYYYWLKIQRISVESREQPVVFLFAKTRVRICA